MTDWDTLRSMLLRASIEHEIDTQKRTITIGSEGPNNEGYSMFFAEFIFGDDLNLVKTGVWE